MSNKAKFAYCATADAARVAEYLTRIAEGLISGSISLTSEKKAISLAPSNVVRVTIDASSNAVKGKGSLVLDISWKAGTESGHSNLEISTQTDNGEDERTTRPNPAGALGK